MIFDDGYKSVGPYTASVEWKNGKLVALQTPDLNEAIFFIAQPTPVPRGKTGEMGMKNSALHRRIFDARGQFIWYQRDIGAEGIEAWKATVEVMKQIGDNFQITSEQLLMFELAIAMCGVLGDVA